MEDSSQSQSKQVPQPGFANLGCMLSIGLLLMIAAVDFVSDSYRTYNERLSRHHECHLNLATLKFALQEYEKDNQSPPPLFTTNRDGEKLHSWRTLLLPYLGFNAKELHDELRLDEPWDSDHNRKVAASERYIEVNGYFQCELIRTQNWSKPFVAQTTSYVAVAGEGRQWMSKRGYWTRHGRSRRHVVLLVTEIRDSNTHWMEPKDITSLSDAFEADAEFTIGSDHWYGLGSRTRRPFHVILPGGFGASNMTVRKLDALTEMQILKDRIYGTTETSD
ncbi:MAG: DUF1559 domain-containing protein [Planctomycetota bacterium]|nr:DUF1559 domain-containing protein [Planctomycetota bacterium]MDA0920455.1 DUF1559 domain-containing protein [Planctomycetota bacterium]MDA1159045.1 DUF1559 domain-containing protein [Planctomycetota bacterium]